MKVIPSLFILGTLALSTTILTGCGGGSSGGITIPTQNSSSFTFTNINSPTGINLSPLAAQGPFIGGGGNYADYFQGKVVTATYQTEGGVLRLVDIRRTASSPDAPAVGTSYELTAGGANTLIYSAGGGFSYEAVSGRVVIASKRGSFVTLRLENVEAKLRFNPNDYRIRINGTYSYDDSNVPQLGLTGAKPQVG